MVYLFSFFNANEGASGATNILEKEVVELEFDFKSFNTVIFFNFNNYFKGRLF